MTDIRRHLPGTLAYIRAQLAIAGEDAPALHEQVRAALAALLPASYASASGQLGNAQGERSQALDVIIYDTTIPATEQHAHADCHALRQALLAITLAPT